MRILLTIIYLITTTGGVIFMKLGGDSLLLSFKDGINFKMGFLTFIGFILYLVSFVLWQKLLITFDLSFIIPFTAGIIQIIILVASQLLFKEQLNLYAIIGIILAITGVVFMSIGRK